MNLKERLKDAKRARRTRVLRNAFVSLGFAAFSVSSQAQTTTCIVDQFNPSGTGGNSYAGGQIGNVWGNWFGGAFQSVTWDSASDANTNPASGSMKITANFGDQFEVFNGFNGINPPLNGLLYTNFQCDVRFDPTSATVMSGGVSIFGHLEFATRKGNDQDYFGSVDIRASNTNWVHVSIALNATTDTNLMNIYDVLIHIYGLYYSPGLSGPSILWVDNIKFVGPVPVSTNCVVDWNDVHQRIDGFGASSAWAGSFTTSQADMFFSTNNGIGLSLVRSRIAPDGTTTETSIMQQAIARGARAWSTPWSPPVAYKDPGTVNGGNFVSSTSNLRNYASQLARYVYNMKTNGINLYAISVQNEPDFNTTGYESCVWTSKQIHDFIPYLHNALVASNVASTKILIAESENWNFNLTTNAINDVTTSNMVDILAAHPYDFTVAPVNRYDKALWETEASTLGASFDGSITNGIYWAGQIHAFLTYAEVNAWHYWWLASAWADNEGLTDNSGNPAKRMYVLGNYSRFVRPGYYRIGVSNNATTLISAYKDGAPGSFAIVAANTSSTTVTQTFNLKNFTTGTVTPWITSSNLSLASQSTITVTNSTFACTLPALSVVTFVGQNNSAPTDISLSNTNVAENLPSGTAVGNISTTDPDAGNTFTYNLVSGAGSTNNGSFTITNNTLYTAASFNYEVKNSYGIRIRSTDQGGLYFEEAFTIIVTDVNEPPNPPVNLSPANGATNQPPTLMLHGSVFSDPDINDSQAASQWLVRRAADSVIVFNSGTDTADKTNLTVASGVLDYGTSYNWQVRYQDNHGAWSGYSTATVFATLAPDLALVGQGGNIVLFWPTNTSGFVLEWTTNLSATNWSPTLPPAIIGAQNVVTNLPASDVKFYRLRKP